MTKNTFMPIPQKAAAVNVCERIYTKSICLEDYLCNIMGSGQG